MTELSKEAWKAGHTDVPLIDQIDWQKWKPRLWLALGAAIVLCLALTTRYFYNRHQAHKAKVQAVQVVPVPEPIEKAEPTRKAAKLSKPVVKDYLITEKQADVPAIVFGNIKAKPVEPESQFDRDLTNFERQIP